MKRLPMYLASFAISAIGITACNTSANEAATAGKPKDFKFIDRANMDTTISPTDNFFLYANGNWLKNTAIPGDQTRWGSFNELAEQTLNNLDSIMQNVVKDKNAAKGSNEKMVADFYKSGMDTVKIEAAGLTPMQPILSRIQAIANTNDLLAEITTSFIMNTLAAISIWKFLVFNSE